MLDYASNADKIPQLAVLKSLGITEQDLKKPLIGIITAANEFTSGSSHLKKLTEKVRLGVELSGGLPVEINLAAFNHLLALGHHGSNFCLPQRELIADSLEAAVTTYGIDALVLLPESVNTAAGMLMAAARLNVPCAVLPGGNITAKSVNGKKVKFATLIQTLCDVKAGAAPISALKELENSLGFDGTIHSIYEPETFFMILEVLGFSLYDASCIPANNNDRLELAKETGLCIVSAFENQITPAKLLVRENLRNAMTASFAMTGNVNNLLHLRAIANENGVNVEKELSNEALSLLADKTPKLIKLFPYSEYLIDDFYRAGGVRNLLSQLNLSQFLSLNTVNIKNEVLEQQISSFTHEENEVIRSGKSPYLPSSGQCFLKGNLAEEGSIFNFSLAEKAITKSGFCKVFDSEEEAVLGIMSGTVRPNSFVVIRGEGPKGGPGLRELLYAPIALKAMKLDDTVTIITDGRVPMSTAGGVVSLCCPEAVSGGLIAGLKDGDTIELDSVKKKLNAKLSAREIEGRMRKLKVTVKELSGSLKRYAHLVTPVSLGSVLAVPEK